MLRVFTKPGYFSINPITSIQSRYIPFGLGVATYIVKAEEEDLGLGKELCQASPEKRSICVSSSVTLAGLSDTITEEPVSSGSEAEETPWGPAG